MFGTIVEIVAKKSLKRKGQAFIVFEDPAAALQAIEDVQGFELSGKAMRLELARSRSDATVKQAATEEDFETHKRRRLAQKGVFGVALNAPLCDCGIFADELLSRP
jgi:RNA recognition motif-containing protein